MSLSSFAQVFLPSVVVRQQAFLSLQGQHEGARELHLPAEWQTDAKSAVALTIGAGIAPHVVSVSSKQLSEQLSVMVMGVLQVPVTFRTAPSVLALSRDRRIMNAALATVLYSLHRHSQQL